MGFQGQWAISPDENMRAEDDQCNDAGSVWAIAHTKGGKIGAYHFHCNGAWSSLKFYDSRREQRRAGAGVSGGHRLEPDGR